MKESEVEEEFPHLYTEEDRNFPLRLGSYFFGEGLEHFIGTNFNNIDVNLHLKIFSKKKSKVILTLHNKILRLLTHLTYNVTNNLNSTVSSQESHFIEKAHHFCVSKCKRIKVENLFLFFIIIVIYSLHDPFAFFYFRKPLYTADTKCSGVILNKNKTHMVLIEDF